jgi:anthranilate phosphoribosyltransferase
VAKITEYLEILLAGGDLTFDQAKGLLDIIFEGDVVDVQIAAFLAAMRAKGATANDRCATMPFASMPASTISLIPAARAGPS